MKCNKPEGIEDFESPEKYVKDFIQPTVDRSLRRLIDSLNCSTDKDSVHSWLVFASLMIVSEAIGALLVDDVASFKRHINSVRLRALFKHMGSDYAKFRFFLSLFARDDVIHGLFPFDAGTFRFPGGPSVNVGLHISSDSLAKDHFLVKQESVRRFIYSFRQFETEVVSVYHLTLNIFQYFQDLRTFVFTDLEPFCRNNRSEVELNFLLLRQNNAARKHAPFSCQDLHQIPQSEGAVWGLSEEDLKTTVYPALGKELEAIEERSMGNTDS